MAIVDTVRPVSTRFPGAGVAVPSGTLHGVTSDNSDSTYIQLALADATENWQLRVGSHTPSAGYQRHRIRGRIKIRTNTGTSTEDIDLGRGTSDYIAYDTVAVTSTLTDTPGSWHQDAGYGLATAGALADLNIGGGWPGDESGGMTELRTAECYVDIDCRFRPDFSPEIQDNAGVDQSGGTITDTNQPVLFFGGVAYDGLPSLNYQVTVTSGATIVYTYSGSGTPPPSVDAPGLPDGAYTATFIVRSTIRGADPFEHSEVLNFSIENTVPPPSPPLVEVTEEFGGYRVTWVNPGGQAWDNDYVVAEVWRTDCTGSQRISVQADAISGSYLDLAIPQLDPQPVPGPDCELSAEPCDITYSVRYWGYVSTFVELPDAIPDDLILGWPGTAGSIPSGWTRVTALDSYFPRGATTTGTPSATGGAASHSHTMPNHHHVIGSHDHDLGGSTGTSNSSTTSARFNGASQPQADQPHSHARPAKTGTNNAANSGNAAPGTSAASNTPPTLEVIWIRSDGARTEYPVGILGWATEAVSGWVNHAAASGRFLRGAAAAGNGGATGGSSTHTHTVDAHIHTGFSHTHAVANTGLSNPSSTQEAGYGSSSPRWLPRHTHPMTIDAASTNTLLSAGGGTTPAANTEPPNRRLQTLRNTGGGIQTRIIGLYTGTVAALDPLLTLCNGANGTPDMRTWFARDRGSSSINSTGGAATHNHPTPADHVHGIVAHSHGVNVLASNTASYERPTSGDLGDSPTTGHTHSSGDTDTTTPVRTGANAGTSSTESNLPTYKEVHFVRLDGTISGGPLPVPELKTSDFATVTVPSFTYDDDLDRLSTLFERIAVVTDRSHDFPRLVSDSTPLDGGTHSVSTTLAGEDLTLTIAVVGKPAIDQLESLLSADRVYFSPLGGTPGWYAPGSWTVRAPAPDVKVVQIPMVRQPWPATPDPSEFL